MLHTFQLPRHDQQAQSPLFSLPPELRGLIFDFAFLHHQHGTSTAGTHACLIAGPPPSKTLLQTCQQAYREARLTQRTLYRLHWERTFTARVASRPFPEQALRLYAPEDLLRIQSFVFYTCYPGFEFKLEIDRRESYGWRVRMVSLPFQLRMDSVGKRLFNEASRTLWDVYGDGPAEAVIHNDGDVELEFRRLRIVVCRILARMHELQGDVELIWSDVHNLFAKTLGRTSDFFIDIGPHTSAYWTRDIKINQPINIVMLKQRRPDRFFGYITQIEIHSGGSLIKMHRKHGV